MGTINKSIGRLSYLPLPNIAHTHTHTYVCAQSSALLSICDVPSLLMKAQSSHKLRIVCIDFVGLGRVEEFPHYAGLIYEESM